MPQAWCAMARLAGTSAQGGPVTTCTRKSSTSSHSMLRQAERKHIQRRPLGGREKGVLWCQLCRCASCRDTAGSSDTGMVHPAALWSVVTPALPAFRMNGSQGERSGDHSASASSVPGNDNRHVWVDSFQSASVIVHWVWASWPGYRKVVMRGRRGAW